MDLSVRDAARLLTVSEDTVYRWIRSGSLPAHRVRHQYRLNRVELQEWAATHDHRVSPELFEPDGKEADLPSLHAALSRGGIHTHVPGSSREEVLRAVARLPGIPETLDRDMLYELLVAREALAGTGIGEGIATPHPRDPVVLHVPEPFVLLCFLDKPVDFGALDGRPVRALFLVLATSVHVHLQLLAQLAFALHDDELRRMLGPQTPRDVILERFGVVERRNEQGRERR
jgi:PTS system nitrogen regulatory IIA component